MNIGSILGIANSSHIILRSSEGSFNKQIPGIGDNVYTAENRKIGVIADIFGPVSKPFVSIKPFEKDIDIFNKYRLQKGSALFTLREKHSVRRTKPIKHKYHAKPIQRNSGRRNTRGKK